MLCVILHIQTSFCVFTRARSSRINFLKKLSEFDLASKVIEIAMAIFFILLQQLITRKLVLSMLQGVYKVKEEFLKKTGTHL